MIAARGIMLPSCLIDTEVLSVELFYQCQYQSHKLYHVTVLQVLCMHTSYDYYYTDNRIVESMDGTEQ